MRRLGEKPLSLEEIHAEKLISCACNLHPGQGPQSLNIFLGAIYSLGKIRVFWVMGVLRTPAGQGLPGTGRE